MINKKNLGWIIGGIVMIIAGFSVWWMWWSAVPYDISDPEVQQKLAIIEGLRQDIKDNENIINSYIEIGHVYEQLGDDRRAVNSYKALARIRPKSSPPFIAMGQFYRERSEPVLAEKNLLKASTNDPDYVPIYQDLSFLYIYNPELIKGRQNFEALILDVINQHQSIQANLIQILAFYFKEIHDTEKAKDYLTQLLELAPERSSDWQLELDDLNN